MDIIFRTFLKRSNLHTIKRKERKKKTDSR